MKRNRGLMQGYRSGLEVKIAAQLKDKGIKVQYEPFKIEYVEPATGRKYTPDFQLPNGIIIESKGRFTVSDRKKHLWIQEQKPELDIRFVFQNPNARLYKGAKTRYSDWCNKNNFIWAEGLIPEEWINE